MERNARTFTPLLQYGSRAASDAKEVLRDMHEDGVIPNVVHYNAAIKVG